jgi:CubicO group peptidase (beta-lactamase class C family)
MLLNKGVLDGHRVISRKSVEMISHNQIGELELWSSKFGYGFEIFTKKSLSTYLCSPGSYRWAGAYSTDYLIDPVENLVYVNFTNVYLNQCLSEIRYLFRYRNLVYQALE